MAKSIRDLRRERGFRSSREFAKALGVSPSSMSRYDKDASLIPVRVAWAMADLLGCSIDEVLGRDPVTSGRSELQEDYDSLSPATQTLVREFMEFAKARDRRLRDDAQRERNCRFDRLCQLYEKLFYQSLYASTGLGDPIVLASPSRERKAFEEFVVQMATDGSGERSRHENAEGKEVIDAIMASYDRRRGRCSQGHDQQTIVVEYTGGPPS